MVDGVLEFREIDKSRYPIPKVRSRRLMEPGRHRSKLQNANAFK
jgi:hypothetical protein